MLFRNMVMLVALDVGSNRSEQKRGAGCQIRVDGTRPPCRFAAVDGGKVGGGWPCCTCSEVDGWRLKIEGDKEVI